MGNPEFNGKKFDYWSDENNDEYGVWNNDMKAKQYIPEWMSIYTKYKHKAIAKAKQLNLKIESKNI